MRDKERMVVVDSILLPSHPLQAAGTDDYYCDDKHNPIVSISCLLLRISVFLHLHFSSLILWKIFILTWKNTGNLRSVVIELEK